MSATDRVSISLENALEVTMAKCLQCYSHINDLVSSLSILLWVFIYIVD